MRKSCGDSRTAKARRRRAAELSQRMRHGDGKAAFSLLQRRRALAGIAKRGGGWRVQLMNAARLRKRDQRRRQAASIKTGLEQRQQAVERSLRLDAGQVATTRAQYGGLYRHGVCQPVSRYGYCPACGWGPDIREPHIIG